jgi:hypothetical protein
VAQVVEAQLAQAGTCERRLVAAPQRGAVKEAADAAEEDEVVVVRREPTLAEPREHTPRVRRERDGPDLARLGRREVADREARADVWFGKSTSRQRRAISSPMRRPVNAAVR